MRSRFFWLLLWPEHAGILFYSALGPRDGKFLSSSLTILVTDFF